MVPDTKVKKYRPELLKRFAPEKKRVKKWRELFSVSDK
jgi:hypothetical protein